VRTAITKLRHERYIRNPRNSAGQLPTYITGVAEVDGGWRFLFLQGGSAALRRYCLAHTYQSYADIQAEAYLVFRADVRAHNS
jgi:hypothetical protein